jgi:hypothetical protein
MRNYKIVPFPGTRDEYRDRMTKYQKQVAKIGRLFRIGKIEEEEYYNLREKFEQLEAKK